MPILLRRIHAHHGHVGAVGGAQPVTVEDRGVVEAFRIDARELQTLSILQGEILLAGALRVGPARLIDNREVRVGGSLNG